MSLLIPNSFGLQVTTERIIYFDKATQPETIPLSFEVVGEGSNILFTQPQFNHPILMCSVDTFHISKRDDYYQITLGGGLNWHDVVEKLVSNNIGGLENLALIPGTVGAAPVQNIGAYGIELSDVCHCVSGINLSKQCRQTLSHAECQFGYRDSVFKRVFNNAFLIEEITLRLPVKWQPHIQYGPLTTLTADCTPRDVFERVCEIRSSKLPNPKELGNAGSFFKNPIVKSTYAKALKHAWPDLPIYPVCEEFSKLAAGYLIDQCGLKGFAINQAAVHDMQALVLVNKGHAVASDIIKLASHVIDTVNNTFGITLVPEVRFYDSESEINPNVVLY